MTCLTLRLQLLKPLRKASEYLNVDGALPRARCARVSKAATEPRHAYRRLR